jgi:hypothetical protein
MGTVLIPAVTGTAFTIYGTYAAADSYIQASWDDYAAWALLDATGKHRALVKAYRVLSGLRYKADVVSESEADIIEASYMLAGFLATNPEGLGGSGGGSPSDGAVKSVKDTVATVVFFPSTGSQAAKKSPVDGLPRDVLDKVKPYLLRAGSVAGAPYASGTDGVSEFTEDTKFSLIDQGE